MISEHSIFTHSAQHDFAPKGSSMIRLALYQPDIPQNAGAAMRLCACLGAGLDVIEPCGFVWDDRKIRRSGMDYIDAADIRRHASWTHFREHYAGGNRLILLTTKAEHAYTDFSFAPGDILLMGQEGSGAPPEVHEAADARLTIRLRPGMRSLNVINAAAMVLGEALRQTQQPA